ncbi:MAG: DUF4367 domain-containing protein [Lachnospiraceae bacterium]|nr:DUF4367 domain-containing protein [Lachnospiraceae bacterium]
MNEKENTNEQNNSVVEAMLRAREKEMQQPPAEEELPGLTSEEYDDMYLKILGRLKAEGLMQEEHAADSEMEEADIGKEKVSRVVAFEDAVAKKKDETMEKIQVRAEKAMEEKLQKEPEKMTEENVVEKVAEKNTANHRPAKIRWFQKKAAKVACICLVAATAMFGLSMTSEANRLRLIQTANEVLGTGDLLNADNGEDRAMSAGSEDEARQEIMDTLNVEVPDFYYLPEGMKYMTYELISDVGYAKIHYSYKKGYLYLEISNSLSDMSQSSIKQNQEDGDESEEIETLSGKMNFVIKNIENGKEQYTASWKYKNVAYNFYGEISYEELIKILQNISFSM